MIEQVISIARDTGKFLRESASRTALRVTEKAPRDYVTQIDLEAEERIATALAAAFPGTSVMAEESARSLRLEGAQWIVDPLDGTKNFIHGIPTYSVSIAFYENGEGRLGVVYDPVHDEMFSAEAGKSAFLNGEPIRVEARRPVEEALLGTGYPFRTLARLDQYLECFRRLFLKVSGMRRAGSACLDQCYVACGRYDGFWEFGLNPWDVGAGSVIVRAAGGVVTDFNGGPDFVAGGDILAARPDVHALLLGEVREVFRGTRPTRS